MKIKRLLKLNLMRAAMMLALILACATAWAQTTVSYIDADGNTQTAQAVALDGNEPTVTEYGRQYINLAGGWYFVGTDITYSDVTIRTDSEDVNLILADGCTMHIGTSASPNTNEGIVRINNLTIYGQNLDPSVAGTLSYVGNNRGIWVGGSYTQHSGNVSISNNLPAGGRGIEAGSVTLLGGTLTIATESRYAKAIYADHDITISGGTLSATATGSSDNIYGIYSDRSGTITLGWTRSADRITASSYSASTVKVADGQVLTDDSGHFYSGTLSAEDISAIGGLTLHPYSNNDFSVNEEGTECTIQTAKGWDVFCDLLAENTKGYFTGKTVALGDDIEVSRMAGNVNHDFTGTFDGNGHTLTFNHTAADNYCAPFRYVQGNSNTDHAFIQNLNVVTNITAADYRHPAGLIAMQSGYVDVTDCNAVVNINCTKGTNNPNDLYPAGLVSQSNNTGSLTVSGCTVSGTISTDGKYAAGMVGIVQSSASITNSVSSVTINSSTSGDGTHSGFVASLPSGRHLTIEGCVFNGKIVTTNGTTNCGGFLGHNNTVGGTGATITNCLYAPTADPNTVSTGCATFGRNVSSDLISNCYYTTALGDAQGTQAYSISGGNYVTVGNAGTVTQSYDVSGLSFYSAGLSLTQPLPEGEEEVALYAAASDVVSLTLGCTAPSGYYCTGYTATAGTLNETTLTMPYGNVTINATLEQVPPVNYVDQNGETQQCTNYIWLTGTETTLGAAGQETWCVVHSTLDYSQGIQLLGNTHIILCDGAAMNIGSSESPVSGPFPKNEGFSGSGNNLSLYAQSGNTGALTIYSQSSSFVVKDLTIAGGNVNATSRSNVTVIGCTNNLTVCRSSLEIHTNGPAVQANDVTLSNVTANINSSNSVGFVCSNFAVDNSQLTVNTRGEAIGANNGIILSNVTANLNSSNAVGLICSNFAVDNSQLTVTAPNPAIQASNVITLGCTAATDFIKATSTNSLPDSYIGTVKIADGQTLYAGTNAYTGTLTDAQRQAIGGQKLTNVAPPTYDYIDLDGTGATHTAVVINADNMPTALSGWYIVQGTVNYTNTINLGGDTHIILADNAVMNVTVGGNYGIQSTSGNNYSFFVYGQTGQSGELNVTSNSIACFISGGDITIAGGKVTASGRIIGLNAQYTNNNGGNVTIKNATVTATGTSYFGILSEYGGNITIDNSNVTATSTGSSGIYAGNGDITIDNSNVTATATVNNGIAIFAENGDIIFRNGGKTTASNSNYMAIYANEGDITITDCEVEAIGGSGIYAYSGNNSGDVGNVTIQNATVTATASFAAIRSNNGNITIDNSNVTATSTGNHGIYAENGNITIASGTVTASGKFSIYTYGSVTINGGQVTTTGNLGIYTVDGSVTINGGQVSAIGNNCGIYAQNPNDNITLGWTNPTDYIYASSYSAGGTLTLSQVFIDEDGQPYSGIIAMENGAYAIDGKTLYPNCVVRKQVAGYGEGNGGWVFIASPVAGSIAPSEVHNLLGSYDEATGKYDYDLYRFNQSDANGKEWQNWNATTTENHPDFTSLVNGQGYLYASREDRTLVFAGEYTAATAPVEVPLDYDENAQLKGWNLVGNPFTTQATMTDRNGQPVSFYVINGQNVVPYEGSAATIEPCTGVMVKAEGTGEKVRFTSVIPDQAPQPNKGSLQIALSQVTSSSRGTKQSSTLDNAIISFNEGSKLSKFYFGTQNANIYIPQGQEEYAIAYSNGQGEMPVNFKAIENGTYTISVDVDNVEMGYLHLIDNMTGADVDLLAANGGDAKHCVSYTFTAKTTDYESRFRLVFVANGEDDSATGSEAFAFFSNGNWIIANDGQATLQVIDINGRILSSESISGSVSKAINAAPGVYVIRLINGNDVKTQKIVVK